MKDMTISAIEPAKRDKIRRAIHERWTQLRRGPQHLQQSVLDSKVDGPASAEALVYVPRAEDLQQIWRRLRAGAEGSELEGIRLAHLPTEVSLIKQHGLLWLPGDYVVPGGRFNEFYGWDSYFILRGLWRDGMEELAQSVCDQALYEVRHYGMVLNANRTYYLTRSQPPVLSLMVRECYDRSRDKRWLQNSMPDILRFYHYWMVPPHYNQGTGLSRYRDLGHGPAPEAAESELDAEGKTHYERARDVIAQGDFGHWDRDLLYDAKTGTLTPHFFLNDRSMRESGFDISHRFGPLNLDVVHFAPVCLNTLLWLMEKDLSYFHAELGQTSFAHEWNLRAEQRKRLINQYFWDEDEGLFLDYHLERRERYRYPFLTTFLPLWSGLASSEQAARVAERGVEFLAPGGMLTSLQVTGCQWDAPFAWAPLQLWAVGGLASYGFDEQAREVVARFLQSVANEFDRSGEFLEKYDAVNGRNHDEAKIEYGYASNEVGFGWTNAVVVELLRFIETGRIDTPPR